MPSTSAPTSNSFAGHTQLPGLQVSPFGAKLNTLKVYNFGVTSTGVQTATSTAIAYTVSGLTTNDVPVSLTPSTGTVNCAVASMFVSASNALTVQWNQSGTSTSGIPGLAAPGAAYSLLTYSYFDQSSSTTT